MTQWTQAFVDSLPDSSFLFIAAGGSKDDEGKTTPRSLRKLPYKDADGKVDHDHLVNAESRLDQTEGIPADEKATIKAKIQKLLGENPKKSDKLDNLHEEIVPDEMQSPLLFPMKLDAQAELPARFPVLTTGHWPGSIKGDFKITLGVLKSIKQKFDAGIGFPMKDASTGLCVNFEHNIGGPAGAWAKGLELEADDGKGLGTLYATNLEYTDEGESAIRTGRYKGISAEGSLAYVNGKLKEIPSHLNLGEKLTAVMTGLAFTNMPFMSMMAPVRLSATPDSDDDSLMVLVKDKEKDSMDLDALRLKEQKDLSGDEVKFLLDKKDQLSAEELKNLGFVVQQGETLADEDREMLAAVKSGKKKVVDNNDDNDGDEMSDADKQMMADIKAGKKKVVDAGEKLDALTPADRETLTAIQSGDKKLVDADTLSKLDRLDRLEAVAEEFEHKKAEDFVMEQLSRGAIKSDQKDSTIKMLLSMEGDARKAFEDHLTALPSNDLLAAEVGHDKEVAVDVTEELKNKTLDTLSKAKAAGEASLTYAQAQDRLMREDSDLRQRYEASKLSK